jgi:hypothetical protein
MPTKRTNVKSRKDKKTRKGRKGRKTTKKIYGGALFGNSGGNPFTGKSGITHRRERSRSPSTKFGLASGYQPTRYSQERIAATAKLIAAQTLAKKKADERSAAEAEDHSSLYEIVRNGLLQLIGIHKENQPQKDKSRISVETEERVAEKVAENVATEVTHKKLSNNDIEEKLLNGLENYEKLLSIQPGGKSMLRDYQNKRQYENTSTQFQGRRVLPSN